MTSFRPDPGAARPAPGPHFSMPSSPPGRAAPRPPLFAPEATRSPRRTRPTGAGAATEEELMERDRSRRPLFELDQAEQVAKIRGIGLGGGGGNAMSRMLAAEFTGVEFTVANTDGQ